jgi:hypothetical protein
MPSVEKTAEELKEERTDYLRARFPRISPTPLPLGQLRGFEDPPGGPMTLFAPGSAALAAFWRLWVNPDPRLGYLVKLECGHPLPEAPPADRRDTLPLRVPCLSCGADVRLYVVEAF